MERQNDKEPRSETMGLRERLMLKELRKTFTHLCNDLDLGPFVAMAVAGQMMGEYAALLDELLKEKPAMFDRHYEMDELLKRLKGKDMLLTFQLNLENGYEEYGKRKEEKQIEVNTIHDLLNLLLKEGKGHA